MSKKKRNKNKAAKNTKPNINTTNIDLKEETSEPTLFQPNQELEESVLIEREEALEAETPQIEKIEQEEQSNQTQKAKTEATSFKERVESYIKSLKEDLVTIKDRVAKRAAKKARNLRPSLLAEFKAAVLSNKKCAVSAALGALSLAVGIAGLLAFGQPGLPAGSEREAHVAINTAEPLIHNHRGDHTKTLASYIRPAVTGVPVFVGLPQGGPGTLITKAEVEPEFKEGDSCEVIYDKSIAQMNTGLNLENPFQVLKTVYNLRVNGEIVATFKTPGEGKQVMDRITALNTNEKSEIVKLEYKEAVEVTKDEASFMDDNTYSKVDDVVNLLMTGTKEMKKYSIVAGDIPETIAEAHGMTIDELEMANPAIVGRGHLLQIGEELNLVIPKPMVNVLSTERQSYVKNVDFEVVEHQDSEMYEGDVVVQEEGEYGRSQVVAEIVRENGREVARKILSEKVLKEPKKEIVSVGTKPAPPRRGSGYLDYPIQRGFEVSSPFGMRWGFLHSGIDLACPLGTPIVAADGGIVTFAGWDSLGGLMVKIDHGGNISTGYAHCDFLAVSEGDMVFKGQYIADVGMTGYTTGPHLHFEVLYNGVYMDPSEYLSFY